MIVKVIIKHVMKAIEKSSDKKIASDHENIIVELEKIAHSPKDFVCLECGCKAKKKKKEK